MTISAGSKHDSYKDSGFDWVGDVPSHWDVERLGSTLSAVSEKNHPNLPLLSITREQGVIERDIEDQDSNHNYIPDDLSGYKLLRKGQFGMNKMKAWQGSYGVSAHTGIVSPAYFIFDFTREVYPRFFNIAIRSMLYVSYFGSASDGVRIGQWDLNQSRMKQIPILLPPLSEQRAIASFLDTKCGKIDEAVRIKEEQIALLKERRQILIQQAVTRGLNPDAPMKDSGIDWIGEIPVHWEVKRLKHLGKAIIGLTYDPKDLCDDGEGTLVLRSSNLKDGKFSYGEELNQYINMRIPSRLIIQGGDILICSRNGSRDLIGKCAFASAKDEGSSFGAFTTVFRSEINRYIFQILNSEIFKILAGSFLTATINQLTTSNLNSIYVPIPPEAERVEITTYLETERSKIDTAISLKVSQIAALKEYKTSLINAAVTGKIKVS
ncbi:restriction endonuclease subunit S [Cohaesibacter celericrescens]|uniref:Restriction endonuclease subunit S n=1 Tax=Cohaesibacter celericrescens TaxID=2067669 RepID=A0A2N5XQH7_9HYPH|nr:restriction endonuclease subunit S [Cohaesibacter celericrescens]PLW76678.1 restriction endonuclease subunit S [Cohaesibacter celericrescens]